MSEAHCSKTDEFRNCDNIGHYGEAEINGYYPGFYGKEDRGYTYINYFFDGDSPVIRDAVSLFNHPHFKGVLIRTDSTNLLLFTSMSYSVSCSVIVL